MNIKCDNSYHKACRIERVQRYLENSFRNGLAFVFVFGILVSPEDCKELGYPDWLNKFFYYE